MRLVASAIVRNERHRYLEPWLDHLAEFCDAVAILDDASTDGTVGILADHFRDREPGFVRPLLHMTPEFDEHEGHARQRLLDWTIRAEPTHVLALDADEFVTDGPALRARLEREPTVDVWTMVMEEIWELDGDCLCVRTDGGWHPYPASLVYRYHTGPGALWQIPDRQLACGRLPMGVSRAARRRAAAGVEALHLGWTNPLSRQARYDRYMRIDGGEFHNRAHLESIMGTPTLDGRPWPAGLSAYRERITAAASRPPAPVS